MTDENNRSYKALYDKYSTEVFNYLLKLTKSDRQVAEVLSQEVWTSFHTLFDKVAIKDEEEIGSWFYAISRNKFLRASAIRIRKKEALRNHFREKRQVYDIEAEIITKMLFYDSTEELSEDERKLILCRLTDLPVEWVFSE